MAESPTQPQSQWCNCARRQASGSDSQICVRIFRHFLFIRRKGKNCKQYTCINVPNFVAVPFFTLSFRQLKKYRNLNWFRWSIVKPTDTFNLHISLCHCCNLYNVLVNFFSHLSVFWLCGYSLQNILHMQIIVFLYLYKWLRWK